jgi:hypothetical protein
MARKEKNNYQYALITGATSGFGYEFALQFAQHGFNLILVARTDDTLRQMSDNIANKYDVRVIPIVQNLFNPEAAEEIYNDIRRRGITVDVLVNNAGQGEYGKFTTYDVARDMDIIQLNILSLVFLTKFFLRDMISRNEGRILQVASLFAKYPSPFMATYGATKAFVLSFTESLIDEVKDTGVTVSVLMPGAADTDFFHKAGAENTVTYREESLYDPKYVAKTAFKALMSGERKIVPGFKNKIQTALSNVLPDEKLASTIHQKMSPSHKSSGREDIKHPASKEERARIKDATGSKKGDYESYPQQG